MLRQVGTTPPAMDYLVYLDEVEARVKERIDQ